MLKAERRGQGRVVDVGVGASGVRLGRPGWGHLLFWKLSVAAQLPPVGSARGVPAHRWVSELWSELPVWLRWSSPDGGSEGRSWAPLSCAEGVAHQRGGMRACAPHGGPASDSREGTSLILAGHLDLCPGDSAHKPRHGWASCAGCRPSGRGTCRPPAPAEAWQRPGARALVVGPAELGPGGPPGVHAPLVLCG